MRKRYLVLWSLAIWLVSALFISGCASIGSTPPTAIPFNRFTAQSVFNALENANVSIQNPQRDMLIGRDAPSTFSDRYIFEVARIAPAGGQMLIFQTPEAMAEWEGYINRLRANTTTRREVIFVYTYGNVILQLNANLTPQEADVFRVTLLSMV